MQLSSEQITEKLVELVRRHVFIYDVKSNKHSTGTHNAYRTLGKASAWKWELMAWMVSAATTTQECE